MTGKISTIIRKTPARNGGYGFIMDEEGRERFFHARDLVNSTFDALKQGLSVTFEPRSGGKGRNGGGNGLRAEHVTVVA